MKARFLVCALAIVALGLGSVASADLVIYDDFPGTSLDTSLWKTDASPAPQPTVSGSVVTTTSTTSWNEMYSLSSWDPTTTNFEWKYAGGSGWGVMGVVKASGTGADNDGYSIVAGHPGGLWGLASTAGGAGQSFTGVNAGDIFDLRQEVYNSAPVMNLYKNNVWVSRIPAVYTTPMEFYQNGCPTHPGDWMSVDYVGTGIPAPTPEPSALVLLGIGLISLLAYAWRKRR